MQEHPPLGGGVYDPSEVGGERNETDMTDSNTDRIVLSSADLQSLLKQAAAEALQQHAAANPEAPKEPKASKKPRAKASKKLRVTTAQRARAFGSLAKLYASSLELSKAGPSFRNLAKAKARRWEATLRTFQSVDGVLKDAKPFREAVTSLWEDGDFGAVAEATEAHAAALWAATPKKTAKAVKDKALGLVNDGKASGFAMIQRVLG